MPSHCFKRLEQKGVWQKQNHPQYSEEAVQIKRGAVRRSHRCSEVSLNIRVQEWSKLKRLVSGPLETCLWSWPVVLVGS